MSYVADPDCRSRAAGREVLHLLYAFKQYVGQASMAYGPVVAFGVLILLRFPGWIWFSRMATGSAVSFTTARRGRNHYQPAEEYSGKWVHSQYSSGTPVLPAGSGSAQQKPNRNNRVGQLCPNGGNLQQCNLLICFRTHNPLVAGSNPAGPTNKKQGVICSLAPFPLPHVFATILLH